MNKGIRVGNVKLIGNQARVAAALAGGKTVSVFSPRWGKHFIRATGNRNEFVSIKPNGVEVVVKQDILTIVVMIANNYPFEILK